MGHGGARVGAGRRPGVPSKRSAAAIREVLHQGKRLPPANLLIIAENSMAMAARFQPGSKDNPNPDYDQECYAFWLDRSREALRDAAPYYSPKLHAVAIATPPSVEEDAAHVDPRETMWQTYKAMRERGELAMKTVSPPQDDSNQHTVPPEPAVVEEEDNGDGVAA